MQPSDEGQTGGGFVPPSENEEGWEGTDSPELYKQSKDQIDSEIQEIMLFNN